jgi:O-antigen ligase
VELGIGVALLVMSASALFPLLYGPASPQDDEVAWLRFLWLPVYAGSILLASWRWRELRSAAVAFGPYFALLVFAGASAIWSIDPQITLRRFEALAFNGVLSLYLAGRFSWSELVRMVAAALLVLALGSLVMCIAFPQVGIQSDINAGAWRGLWPQKNELGFMMVISALSSLASAVMDRRRRILWIASAALSFGLLVLSRSGTSLLCLMSSGSLLAAFVLAKRRPVVAVMVTFIAGCFTLVLAGVLMFNVDFLFQVMGKDPTFSGRTDVWTSVMRRVAERPALGYGYAAFWRDRMGPALLVRRETGWDVPSAHNGWLEILLQLGWVGVAMAGAYCALTAAAAVRNLFTRTDGFWAIMYVGAFLMLSFSESDILRQNSLEWILLVATSTKLIEDMIRRPRQAAARLAVIRTA